MGDIISTTKGVIDMYANIPLWVWCSAIWDGVMWVGVPLSVVYLCRCLWDVRNCTK